MKLSELEFTNDYFELEDKFYQKVDATPLNHPHLISYNKKAFEAIGLDESEGETPEFVAFLNGELILKGSVPYSMGYAGHQFGYFVPQLGDGRAINLGQVNGWHLQTKGSGLTRYSRQGDGRAVLRSSIREYIMSEAMHGLGIPTTRALGLIGSKHPVYRSYEEVETGAVVMRMSPSWVRFGTFEFFARHKKSKSNLQQLADYVIRESYPHLENESQKYEKLFYAITDATAKLMAQWQAYGFMHGVMNTDNMSIAGLTIDYGPFAFMDYFDVECICNHTDAEGRYSYINQPYIGRWNLEVLAHSLGKICDENALNEYLNTYMYTFKKEYWQLMSTRIGLQTKMSSNGYSKLIQLLIGALQEAKMDYNYFFYQLTHLKSLDDISSIIDAAVFRESLKEWFAEYQKAIDAELRGFEKAKETMKRVNPNYIIKNYMLQEAIDKASTGDFSLTNKLLEIAQNPFDEHPGYERYKEPTPLEFANLQLSCSS